MQKNEKKSFFRLEDQSITFMWKSRISLLEYVKDHSESIHQFGCEIDDIFESIDVVIKKKGILVREVEDLISLIKKSKS